MRELHYFDYQTAAREAGIDDQQLLRIENLFRADYPRDDLLFELHVLRACRTIRDVPTTLAEILRETDERGTAAA